MQPAVALSTTEAEYMAAGAATARAIFLRNICMDLGNTQVGPTIIAEDNQGCIGLAKTGEGATRAKHIDRRHHFIKDAIKDGKVVLKYTPTDEQPADILTKALPRLPFEKFRNYIMGLPSNMKVEKAETLGAFFCHMYQGPKSPLSVGG